MAYAQECRMTHGVCFARNERGKCTVLSDTDFGGKDCPFYKSLAQAEEEERAERAKIWEKRRRQGEK